VKHARIPVAVLAVFSSFVIRHSSLAQERRALPNDCAIVAVEKENSVLANARLRHIDIWTRVLYIHQVGASMGHAVCVFQPHPDRGDVWAYDRNHGTCQLTGCKSHSPEVIGEFLQPRFGRIDLAHFIE
jgi:hypothetical protein